jgi:outer membrane immunogenic protein
MKKLLVAGIAAAAFYGVPALAADMPTKAPVYKAADPVFNWTGFYIGGQVGYGWGDSFQCFSCGTAAAGATNRYNISGAVGGGTAGYNWQLNPNWVVGVETDLSFANIKGTGHTSASFGCLNNLGTDACNTSIDWFGTVRGRIGFASNNVLYYGTGGWAYGRIKADIDRCAGTAVGDCGSGQANGWAAGGGIEYAFARAWSAKIEYLRVDLGKVVYSNAAGSGCAGINCSADAKFNVVRVGLNYRFGSQ